MTVKAFWLEMYPVDPATGLTVPQLFTTMNNSSGTLLVAGKTYYPYLESFPQVALEVFNGEFSGESSIAIDNINLTSNTSVISAALGLVWDGARAAMFKGDALTITEGAGYGAVTQIFEGVVKGAPTVADATASVSLVDKSYLLEVDVLTLSYSGTGGINGPSDYVGTLKPLALGYPISVSPLLIDPAFLCFQYHAYGRSGGVQVLSENGIVFGPVTSTVAWAGSITATYTALKAVTLTLGQWADAPSIGVFRLGGEPVSNGVIACDVAGQLDVTNTYVLTTASDIIKYLLNLTGLSPNNTSVNAWQTAVGMEICDYLTEQQQINNLISSYVKGAGGYYYFNASGLMCLGLVRVGSSTLTVRSDATTSPVYEDGKALSVSAPFKSIRLGARQCFRVHTVAEISDALKVAVNTGAAKLATIVAGATADITLVPVNPDNVAVTGNTIQRYAGTGTWNLNGSVSSLQFYIASAIANFKLTDADTCAGMSTLSVLTATPVYNQIEYGVIRSSDGHWYANTGATSTDLGTGFTSSTIWTIIYRGKIVSWLADGVSVREVNSTTSLKFYFAAASKSNTGHVTNIQFNFFADITALNVSYISQTTNLTVEASTAGVINMGELPASTSNTRYLGDTDVSANTNYSIVSSNPGLTITLNNTSGSSSRGNLSVTAATAKNDIIVVKSTYQNVDVFRTITWERRDAPPPAGGGTGGGGGTGTPGSPASVNTFTPPGTNSASYTVMSSVLAVVVGSSGNVNLTFPASFGTSYEGSFDIGGGGTPTESQLAVRYEYSANGTSGWTAGTVVNNNYGAYNYYQSDVPRGFHTTDGNIGLTQSKTGLTSGATAYFRLTGILLAGLSVNSISGTFTATPA